MSPLFSAFKRKPKETRITVPHTPCPAQALLAAPSGSRAPDAPKSSSVRDAPNSSSIPDGPTSFNPPTAITDAIIARAPKGPNEWYCIDEDGDILATVPPCPAGFNPALFEVLVSETLLLAARISTIAGFLGADMPELEGMRPVTQRTGRRMGLSNKTFTTVVYDAALAAQHPPRGTATGYRFCSIGPYFQLGVEKAVAQWIKMVKECRRVGAAPVTALSKSLRTPYDPQGKVPTTVKYTTVMFTTLPFALHPLFPQWQAKLGPRRAEAKMAKMMAQLESYY